MEVSCFRVNRGPVRVRPRQHKVAGSLIRGFPYTYRLKVSDIDYLQYNIYYYV